MRSSLIFLISVWILALARPSLAQFSVADKEEANKIQTLLQQQNHMDEIVDTLLELSNREKEILSEQNAVDLAAVLQQAAKDPETQDLIVRLQAQEESTLTQLKSTSNMEQTILGMIQVVEELKMLEIVFEDKERALRLMQEEGMVDPQRVPLYQANPDLLEEDTRKGLYFTFVTLGVTAGFL